MFRNGRFRTKTLRNDVTRGKHRQTCIYPQFIKKKKRIKALRLPQKFYNLNMKEKIHKTNAARQLDELNIPYELIPYKVNEEDLSAAHVAAELGENIDQVYKTLVLRGDKTGPFVCVISGGAELDLKAAARASGNKSCEMVHVKELFALTGYIRGGCSPLGMKKHFPTFIHEDCILWDYIYISAGIRGLQIKINPDDLLKAARAQTAPLCR